MNELDALRNEADQIDAAVTGTPAPAATASPATPEQPPAVDYADEARSLLTFAASMLAPLYPSIEKIYTPDTIEKLSTKAAPVMQKYGLTAGGLFERWKVEIDLAMVAVPLAIATYKGIRADLVAMKEQAAKTGQGEPGATLEA